MKKFFLTGALVLAMACPGFAKTYNVSVSQFVEHPSLDAVLKGFQDSLKAQGVDATYSVHNAQANMATANQIAAQIAGEKPDLVLAIATPAAQACALATKKSPILAGSPLLFTAITDPVGAGLVDDMEKPGKNITGVSDMLPVNQHMAMLRREPARIHEEWIGKALKDKRVLVTGAGGSIGRELCRQIARWNPASLVLLGHGENSIFEALLELKADYPHLKLEPVIADVRDHQRLDAVFAEHRPQVVFHAAAHKHVPLMEMNVEEAVANNILGTQNVVETADRRRVERLVLISTDKAVHPANVYGATKRMAEMIVLDAARRTGNAFSVVRFGNVLGSRGSVVPLFKRMIAAGGPLTITHPDMERFFMTIPEAVHLVLQAAAMGEGGEAFLLNMGEQVRILNLAEDLIRLSGLEPGRDIEIVFTGIRPGEKLREELWEGGKTYDKTAHPDVFCSMSEDMADDVTIRAALERFTALVASSQPEAIIDLLDEVVPGSAIRANIRPKDVMDVV